MEKENKIDSKENPIWMDIIAYLGYIGPFIICFYILHQEIQKQSDRTDKIYEMMIEILKEGR